MDISEMPFSGKLAALGTQLAEVFSIYIKPNTFGDHAVFGTIYVKDDIGDDILALYDQKASSPGNISARGSSLPLKSPSRAISAAKRFTLYVDLRDTNGNTEFIKDTYTWDADIPTLYDDCQSIQLNGKLGCALIYFTILSVAVTATISLKLDKEMSGFTFYGSVVAHYEKNFIDHLPNKDVKGKCHFFLFNKTCDEAVLPENGVQIPMSRSLVAVPVFSTLMIRVDLWQPDPSGQMQPVVSGDVEFEPKRSYFSKKTIQKHDISVNVVVNWELSISPFLRKSRSERGFLCCTHIFELTSVRIVINRRDDNRYAEVYGDLYAADSRDTMYLFTRDKDVSVPLLSDDTIPLEIPWRCLDGSDYGFILSLNEKCRDLEICHGYFELNPGVSWNSYNSRLAAVIQGKDGYAVVHFTAFNSAVQATVEATLCGVDGETAISGSLTARIGNYEYASDYVRKYFQTWLLNVPEDEPIMLKPECEGLQHSTAVVTLSNCAVAVPDDCPLIIEANLTHSKGFVRDCVTFSPQLSGEHFAHLGDKDGGMNVKVSWFKHPYNSPGVRPVATVDPKDIILSKNKSSKKPRRR